MAVFVEFCYREKHQHSTEEEKKEKRRKGGQVLCCDSDVAF